LSRPPKRDEGRDEKKITTTKGDRIKWQMKML